MFKVEIIECTSDVQVDWFLSHKQCRRYEQSLNVEKDAKNWHRMRVHHVIFIHFISFQIHLYSQVFFKGTILRAQNKL